MALHDIANGDRRRLHGEGNKGDRMTDQRRELTIDTPRLPYPAAFKDRYGVDAASWRALIDAVWPGAKTIEAVMLALSYCHAKQLDPFRGVVHIVAVWNSKLNREVEGVWPGIASYRIDAMRTGEYGGDEPTAFGPTKEFEHWTRPRGAAKDIQVKVAAPEWAQKTVHRMTQGSPRACHGPRVLFDEFYGRKSRTDHSPNEMWSRKPFYMLEKCAEAAALRHAFPEALGGTIIADEIQAASAGVDAVDVTSAPRREDYVGPDSAIDALPPEAEQHMEAIAHEQTEAPAETDGSAAIEQGGAPATGATLVTADGEVRAEPSPAAPSPSATFVQNAIVFYGAHSMVEIFSYNKANESRLGALASRERQILYDAEATRRGALKGLTK